MTSFDKYRTLRTLKQIVAAATLTLTFVLGCREGVAQVRNSQRLTSTEQAAAHAFESVLKRDWRPMKMLVRPNLQVLCKADKFTDPNGSEWGMGFEDFERITYANETQLDAQLRDLVSDWKAGRRRKSPSFYKDKFPNVHRFAIKSCDTDGTTTIVVAVYLSSWDARKQSVALMLGR
jgi:hypothetical protein